VTNLKVVRGRAEDPGLCILQSRGGVEPAEECPGLYSVQPPEGGPAPAGPPARLLTAVVRGVEHLVRIKVRLQRTSRHVQVRRTSGKVQAVIFLLVRYRTANRWEKVQYGIQEQTRYILLSKTNCTVPT
jgi:hypothetical protein